MKKFNKNRNKPWLKETNTIHNKKKKFDADKFGQVWKTIRFENKPGLKPVGAANQPVIGTLYIGGHAIDMTYTECNRLGEVLRDGKHVGHVSKKLGITERGGSPVSFDEVQNSMY